MAISNRFYLLKASKSTLKTSQAHIPTSLCAVSGYPSGRQPELLELNARVAPTQRDDPAEA